MVHVRRPSRPVLALLATLVLLAAGACGSSDDETAASGGAAGTGAAAEPVTVRLGYFPNITHAPALVGVKNGLFEEALGANTVEYTTFNSGTEATEAIFADALDISYIGPNPAINAWAKSNGEAIRIVSGSTSGGAFLVVKPGITSAEDLRGKVLATPSLGNTQDVALRAWLKDEGLSTDTTGGGDVSIQPQENSDTLTLFQSGDIDGAWVPEPWATRLIQEGGGEVLVDEADLWPDGQFVTTHIIVATPFLEEHPDVVKQVLQGHLAALAAIEVDPATAKADANAQIEAVTDKPLKQEVIDAAWENLEFTADPVATSLQGSADDAIEVGLLDPVDLQGIYALDLLNELLVTDGQEEVSGL